MCFGSKTKTTTNQTQTSNPYGPVSGVLNQGAGVMQNYLSNPASNAVYSGPRVADLSGDTQSALNMLRSSDGATSAMDYFKGVMNAPQASGGGFGTNPYIQQMQDAIKRNVMATNNSLFSSAGMTGGTQHQESLAKGLADGLAQPLFAAYENDANRQLTQSENDRNRRMTAAGSLSGLDQQRINNQIGAGEILDSYNQSKINAGKQLFDETRTAPMKAWGEVAPLAIQMGSAFPTTNSSRTSVSKESQGLGNTILGGAMAGLKVLGGISGAAAGLGSLTSGSSSAAPWTFSGQRYASNGSFDLNDLIQRMR